MHNDQRRLIWRGFLTFIELIRPIQELNLIYVDGGFVTDNAYPKDVDVVVEYPDMATMVRLTQNNRFLQRNYVKDQYINTSDIF